MAEGWMVLTQDVLSFYDRDPRGVTRKPINRFVLNQPGVAYILLPSISRAQLPQVSPTTLLKAFGLQIYSTNTSKEVCLVATSLQSKIDWVEALQKVLTQYGSPPPHRQTCSVDMQSNEVREASGQGCSVRELKEVTIVPIATPKKSSTGTKSRRVQQSNSASSCAKSSLESNDSIDLSIHSSMLEVSSDSSFI